MDRNPFLIDGTAAVCGNEKLSQRAVCPGCHTPHPSLTHQGLAGGVGWQCVRCGERWDARRLAAVAAYAAWVAERDAVAAAGAAP